MPQKKRGGQFTASSQNKRNLAVNSESPKTAQRREGLIRNIIPKTLSRIRSDISTWQSALRAADNVDTPRRARLVNLQEDIMNDAHLTSQYELRQKSVLSAPFEIQDENGNRDEEATNMVLNSSWAAELNRHIHDTIFWGHSLVELTTTDNATEPIKVTLLPRQNVVPEKGMLLLRESDQSGVKYRELREYGTWVLEFGKEHDYGLLNKAVPHVLFMRFAQSCWSELCEIYGIPPRYMKTNTQDPQMLDRAENMLRDMGAAAWFIIDNTEEFQFAKGADTNGDVYRNLMSVCKEALSLLFNGVVVGQDTVNGNRSKEESSLKLLDMFVQADRRMSAGCWNSIAIPALIRIGVFKPGRVYAWQKEEDIEKLWDMTKELLQYKDVPNEWITEKFGIECSDKTFTMPGQLAARLTTQQEKDFFDPAP